MATYWRFDPSKVHIGDTVFVAKPHGWSGQRVEKWTVNRITPAGMVVIKCGDGPEVRLTKGGLWPSDGGRFSRGPSIVPAEEAAEIDLQARRDEILLRLEMAGEKLVKAAKPSRCDLAVVNEAIDEILAANGELSFLSPSAP